MLSFRGRGEGVRPPQGPACGDLGTGKPTAPRRPARGRVTWSAATAVRGQGGWRAEMACAGEPVGLRRSLAWARRPACGDRVGGQGGRRAAAAWRAGRTGPLRPRVRALAAGLWRPRARARRRSVVTAREQGREPVASHAAAESGARAVRVAGLAVASAPARG
ncbi:unnamed protein product [[Actinomadura] parvosata subsp. kistnae]|nr:unnamed protein product [Actinomadura parvosata subsp. kistnae]